MDEEETKRLPRRLPFAELDQVNSDFALALALQEQERMFNAFTAIETMSDEEEDEESTFSEDDEFFSPDMQADLEFLDGEDVNSDQEVDEDDTDPADLSYEERPLTAPTVIQTESHEEEGEERGFSEDADIEFLEGEDSNSEQDVEEDDTDSDELSYEELVALGEIAGVENRGLSVDEISSSLRPYKSESVECKTGIDRNIQMCRCVICQVEFEGGEMLVALPCDHPYHSDCISKWLQIGKICPICGTDLSSTKTPKTLSPNE